MKIRAKVYYADKTHRRVMEQFKIERRSYQHWIDTNNNDMINYTYIRLKAMLWSLVMADCITLERFWYMEKELNEMRGWVV